MFFFLALKIFLARELLYICGIESFNELLRKKENIDFRSIISIFEQNYDQRWLLFRKFFIPMIIFSNTESI